MDFPFDNVDIDRTAVGRGLSAWYAMASDLEKQWPQLKQRLQQAHGAAPWGNAAEGGTFRASYQKDDGPDQMLETADLLVGEIMKAGTLVRESVANTFGIDLDYGDEIKKQGQMEV
ncbi:hypothetical protein [Streptosporangium sp. KLBMP 9127]|nr:hypothetical protein [Streptosporangium sp. KLBMP 9127]